MRIRVRAPQRGESGSPGPHQLGAHIMILSRMTQTHGQRPSELTSPPGTVSSPQLRRRPNRLAFWIVRILLGVLALIVLLALGGASYEAIMAAGDGRRYPPPGKLVDVGGYRLHLHCIGQGSPTVVLDAGLGGFSLDWGAVQPHITTSTRVCAYDRAGLGWSEPGPTPRSPQQFAAELHALLTNAGVEGPMCSSPTQSRARRHASSPVSTRTKLRGWCSSTRGTNMWTSTSHATSWPRRGGRAAAVREHDQVDGKVWAGASAVGAGVAERAAREREPHSRDADRHRRPTGAATADRNRSS